MIRGFGKDAQGAGVQAISFGAGGLRATVLTHGAILQELRLEGVHHGLTLGSDRMADYLGPMCYHGPIVGPVANRISGARAQVDARDCRFEANEGGRHCLHSGRSGSHARPWQIAAAGPDHLTLTLALADGEGGFPGHRRITALWQALPPATLRLTIRTETDAATLVNFTNHSYWNLDGARDWSGHHLRIAADRVTEVDADLIPTGHLPEVAGTPLDLRVGRAIRPGDPVLDTNFCLSDTPRPLREVLWLTGQTGLRLALATTEPGVQVYDNRMPLRPGAAPHEGLAIEPQHWPDAPHQPGFPSILLAAGARRDQITEWRFTR